jgi:hypothetical protein
MSKRIAIAPKPAPFVFDADSQHIAAPEITTSTGKGPAELVQEMRNRRIWAALCEAFPEGIKHRPRVRPC